jgi:hypothetical protein
MSEAVLDDADLLAQAALGLHLARAAEHGAAGAALNAMYAGVRVVGFTGFLGFCW